MTTPSIISSRLVGAVVVLTLLIAPQALGLQDAPRINGLEVRTSSNEVELATLGRVEYGYFPLSDPDRIVFDFPGATLGIGDGATMTRHVEGASFAQIRMSQFSVDPPVVRLVLYLREPATARVRYAQGEDRFVIQALPGGSESEGMLITSGGPRDLLFGAGTELGTPTSNTASGAVLADTAPPAAPEEAYEIRSSERDVTIRFPSLDADDVVVSQLRFPDRLHVRMLTLGNTDGRRPRFEPLQRGNIWNAVAKQWASYADRQGLGVVDLTVYLYRDVGYSQSIGLDGVPEVRLFTQPSEIQGETAELVQVEVAVYPEGAGHEQTPEELQVFSVDSQSTQPERVQTLETVETVEVIGNGALIPGERSREAVEAVEPVTPAAAQSSGAGVPASPLATVLENLLNTASEEGAETPIYMRVGEVEVVPVVGLVRASVGNPTVATVNVISQDEILITALAPGSTALLTWEAGGRHVAREVNVLNATGAGEEEIERVIGDENIKVRVIMAGASPGVVLEGVVDTEEEAKRAGDIAALYAGEERVSNLIEITDPRQVLVKVRVVEIDKRALDEHLSHFSASARTDNDDFTIGIITDVLDPENPGGGLIDTRVRPGIVNGEAEDMVFDPVDMMLSKLESQRDASVLSEPNLVTMSGHPAHFRVGGEIPYTYQNENGFNVVDFREFGISLDITPNVDSRGNIQLLIEPTVRTVDMALAIAGIPGFRTREIKTEVQLQAGETLVIGGLIQREVTEIVSKIPLLGDIPILGELFRSRRFNEDETELVVFLTPHIIEEPEMSERIVGVGELEP